MSNSELGESKNQCPLCRTQYNAFLPHNEVGDPKKCFPENSETDDWVDIDKASNKELFVELLKSMPNLIGFQGVLDENTYLNSKKSIANCLFLVMKSIWATL